MWTSPEWYGKREDRGKMGDRCVELSRLMAEKKISTKAVRDETFEMMAGLMAQGRFFNKAPTEAEARSDEFWAGEFETWRKEKRDKKKAKEKDLFRQNKKSTFGK